MSISDAERHAFIPSRPGGTVCVSFRDYDVQANSTEVCGYPAGHPIHDAASVTAKACTGISDRAAAALARAREALHAAALSEPIKENIAWHINQIEAALREGGAR